MYRLSQPWLYNVAGYTVLFATADVIQQSMLGKQSEGKLNTEGARAGEHRRAADASARGAIDWIQMGRVALIGFVFHANFNYHWLRALERAWPGSGAKRVVVKVIADQLVGAPATITAFYTGLSVLEGREPFGDLRDKFWTSYMTGLLYWSTVQVVNFSLIPPSVRTVFVGGASLLWTVFLCNLRQQQAGGANRH
ncbi:mpv17-like protein [Amia ocellicauda]|uniref:mpv17-like protein n=1 Tax=Amia ocellicauda TaxID=2972642 RepID=UPI0034646095|nr:MP17L protein [Amia calva]